MGSSENIFDSMLTKINYSNFLEAIVNGVVIMTPLEAESKNKRIAIKRKQPHKSVETEQLTGHFKKANFVEKSTQTEINHDKSSVQTSTNSSNIAKSNKFDKIKKFSKSLRVSIISRRCWTFNSNASIFRVILMHQTSE